MCIAIFCHSMCAYFKINNKQIFTRNSMFLVLMLHALINHLKNQSLIFISFQHIDLDAW